jgi:hypothetical protein
LVLPKGALLLLLLLALPTPLGLLLLVLLLWALQPLLLHQPGC